MVTAISISHLETGFIKESIKPFSVALISMASIFLVIDDSMNLLNKIH